MATVQLRKEDVGEVKDVPTLLARLGEMYAGKWVAIMQDGQITADEELGHLYDKVNDKKVATLLQIPKKGELLLL